jgi:hypothetical protein
MQPTCLHNLRDVVDVPHIIKERKKVALRGRGELVWGCMGVK